MLQYFVIDALKIILFEHLSCILSKVGEAYDAGFIWNPIAFLISSTNSDFEGI